MKHDAHPATPRRIATGTRASIVVGTGLTFGFLTAHLQTGQPVASLHEAAQPNSAVSKASEPIKPKVVTIVRKKHVKSKPIIVYRTVPAQASSSRSGWSQPNGTAPGTSNGPTATANSQPKSAGGTTQTAPRSQPAPVRAAPAPKPAPVQAPAPTTSKAS